MSFIRKALGVSALVGLVTLEALANGPGVIIVGAAVLVTGKVIGKLSGNRGPLGLSEEELEDFRNLKESLDITD